MRVRFWVAVTGASILVCWAGRFSVRAEADSKEKGRYLASWSPVTGVAPRDAYAGSEICSSCHTDLGKTSPQTPMGQATLLPSQFDLLQGQAALNFQTGPYRYDIRRQGEQFVYSVTDGKNTLTEPIQYVFGYGMKGQTYVFFHDGAYYESHLSYYLNLRGLDVTFGRSFDVPDSLDKALGERLSPADTNLCFSCHNTAAVTQGKLNTHDFMPGVSCEDCHGPGADHVAAMKAGKFGSLLIFNPGRLEPGDLVDFCGSCHRTWEQVVQMQVTGVRNVRFQPYRLSNSRCWSFDDARISCIACHDPHVTLRAEPASYDSKCLACHVTGHGARPNKTHPGRACPVAQTNCVTCHMPKYTLPEGKSEFTDHFIRIVRKNAPYPD